MTRAYSLNIGLNCLDRTAYGTEGLLQGCLPDAMAMNAVAKREGYVILPPMLNAMATRRRVLFALTELARTASANDLVLFSASCHGTQFDDPTEDDGMGEGLCLYDEVLTDRAFFTACQAFAPGVRLLVVIDACFSGGALRSVGENVQTKGKARFLPERIPAGFSLVPKGPRTFAHRAASDSPLYCSCILLSACSEHEVAADGPTNGLFTDALLATYKDGKFHGSYADLSAHVARRTGDTQHPQLITYGPPDEAFLASRPFRIPKEAVQQKEPNP